jgi:hypothetical protein
MIIILRHELQEVSLPADQPPRQYEDFGMLIVAFDIRGADMIEAAHSLDWVCCQVARISIFRPMTVCRPVKSTKVFADSTWDIMISIFLVFWSVSQAKLGSQAIIHPSKVPPVQLKISFRPEFLSDGPRIYSLIKYIELTDLKFSAQVQKGHISSY